MNQQLINTISAHINQGSFDEAISLFKSNEANNKQDAQYWELLALTQGMAGNNEECKNACLQAIELNPNNIGTYINLGVAQQNLELFDETEQSLKKALSMNDSHPQVQNNLGALYILKSEHITAKPYVEKAISLQPDYSDAHSNMGEIQKHLQNNDAAINSYLKAIELNVNNINAHIGLGMLHSTIGNFDDAEHHLQYAIQLNPHHSEAFFNLGFLHYLKKSYDLASNYFEKTIQIDPNHHNATYLLSAITGKASPDQSPKPYVTNLFDHYADKFDDHLVNSLGYDVPNKMYSLFEELAQPAQTENLLDLGCGTGISGQNFHSLYSHLSGIDLSENMLAKAKEKNIYDALHNVDITDYLDIVSLRFDLVIAADVFVYIGNINKIVKSIYTRQNKNGYFIFSVEKSLSHQTFHLRETGRYSHNTAYIESLLKENSYNIITAVNTIIRKENGNNVEGMIYLCQK